MSFVCPSQFFHKPFSPLFFLFCYYYFNLLTTTNAEFAWRKVSVSGSYRPRAECSFSKCGPTHLCLLGGRGQNHVDILDTNTMTWTKGVTNSLEMNHVQAVQGPDGCAWLAGAWTGPFPNEKTVDDIWRYCPTSNKWDIVTSISRPRGAGGTVFYQGKLYLVSGNVGGHNTKANIVPWFDCYDPSTGLWTELPDVPTPRDHFHAVVQNDKLYVIGGRDSTYENVFADVESVVDVYDFASSSWTSSSSSDSIPDFPRPRGGTSGAAWNGGVAIVGGEGDGRAWGELDLYIDGAESFSFGPKLPVPRHGTGVVSCGSSLWIAGGATVLGCCDNAQDTYVLFNADNNSARPPVCTTTITPTSTSRPSNPSPSLSNTPSPSSPTTTLSPTLTPSVSVNSGSGKTPLVSTSISPSVTGISPVSSPLTESPSISSSSDSDFDSPEPSNNEPACFPGSAMVQLESGDHVPLSSLTHGDVIRVSHDSNEFEFSPVYFFSHAHSNIHLPVIDLYITDSKTAIVSASPGHLIHILSPIHHLIPMHRVQINDIIQVNGSSHRVTRVSRSVIAKGRYNPHTLHGDIVVNSVKMSTYTTTVHPTVAKTLLLPFRIMYHVFGTTRFQHSLTYLQFANRLVLRTLDIMYWKQ